MPSVQTRVRTSFSLHAVRYGVRCEGTSSPRLLVWQAVGPEGDLPSSHHNENSAQAAVVRLLCDDAGTEEVPTTSNSD